MYSINRVRLLLDLLLRALLIQESDNVGELLLGDHFGHHCHLLTVLRVLVNAAHAVLEIFNLTNDVAVTDDGQFRREQGLVAPIPGRRGRHRTCW